MKRSYLLRVAIVELSSDTQISRSALRSGLLRVISAKLSWRERGKSAELARKLILSSFASENDT